MKAVSAPEMRELDRRAIEDFGIPGVVLMENAGRGAADVCAEFMSESGIDSLLVIAGKGNNGGDGFVIARHLVNRGFECRVGLCCSISEVNGDAKINLDTALKMGIEIRELKGKMSSLEPLMAGSGLIVDALLGTGLSSNVSGFYADVIEKINQSGLPIISIDIPSGLDATSGRALGVAVEADLTVTFCLPKTGLLVYPGAAYTGGLIVADIGIPQGLLEDSSMRTYAVTGNDIAGMMPPRDPESHKGTYGHVLVLAGSTGKTGAAVLAAQSALKSGSGLVSAAVPASLNPILEAKLTEVMTEALPENEAGMFCMEALDNVVRLLEGKSSVLIGPGMGRCAATGDFVRALLLRLEIPAVVDADGLWHLAAAKDIIKSVKAPIILTPHPGEMAHLIGKTTKEVQDDRIGTARGFAEEYGCIVVLKGARTITSTPEGNVYINMSGNPGMASAGTGDVLSGIMASLLGQGMETEDAAVSAVWIHGEAGDRVAEEKGEAGLTATDIIEMLPLVLKDAQGERRFAR